MVTMAQFADRDAIIGRFKLFTEQGRTHARTATIMDNGNIGLSRGATRAFGFESVKHVVLGYDQAENEILIAATTEGEPGARRLRHRSTGGGADISAKTFLDFHGIPYGEKCKCALAPVPDGIGVMVIRLNEEGDSGQEEE